MSTPAPAFPPVAADVVADAVESLSPRLRKKLDAAIEQYAALPITAVGAGISVTCGEDAVVTVTPDASGAVTQAEQAQCSCLLAPRCLHRAALLSACPIADAAPLPDIETGTTAGAAGAATPSATVQQSPDTPSTAQPTAFQLTTVQISAAAGLWSAAAAVLAAGIPAAGAVPQAELLRAAHTARLAGLHRAEAAALRVVSSLRDARARRAEHRLADLASALRDLLLTAALLAAADADPSLVGVARRPYEPGGALRVHGVCREPIISATGYAGVVTHLIGDDGRWYRAADVKPGGPGRAQAAATAPVTIGAGSSGAATLDHARLARGGLLINGATVSADGRLGSGKDVRATPISGLPWSEGPVAALLARPIADVAAERLAVARALGDEQDRTEAARDLVGCDVEILAGQGDHLLVRDLTSGTALRLAPADAHADLAHTSNLRQLASRPGMRVRIVGRLDPDRSATLRPLGVGPAPATEATLRLPDDWLGHADLGYDRLQGSHLPPLTR
ncbi:MAG TPA: SWIM zinc finger family protein, partial [Actinocrinis sp.]|nr:SWIM zinc finger family protein [Actinocrinis sp.]